MPPDKPLPFAGTVLFGIVGDSPAQNPRWDFCSYELFGLEGDLQSFLCLGVGAAGAPYLAMAVLTAASGFLGHSGRGSATHTIKLAPADARMPHP
jgi:hypothetical protein